MSRFSHVRRHARQLASGRETSVREHERRVPTDPRDVYAQRYRETSTDPDVKDQLTYYGNLFVTEYEQALAEGHDPPHAEEIAWECVEEEMDYDESQGDHVYVTQAAVGLFIGSDPEMRRRVNAAEAHGAARMEASLQEQLTGVPDVTTPGKWHVSPTEQSYTARDVGEYVIESDDVHTGRVKLLLFTADSDEAKFLGTYEDSELARRSAENHADVRRKAQHAADSLHAEYLKRPGAAPPSGARIDDERRARLHADPRWIKAQQFRHTAKNASPALAGELSAEANALEDAAERDA